MRRNWDRERKRAPDYDFLSPPADPQPSLTQANCLLLEAGRQIGVLSLATGRNHEVLQQAAEFHAQYQADRGVQGHQDWDRRYRQLVELMPDCNEFRECCAESWDWNTMEEAAPEMFKSWRQSPGHWSAINGRCSFCGYAMALNERKNVWYACAILANLRTENRPK